MKIVYCIPGCFNSGGMERVLSIKANYLVDVFGYDVTIITSSQNSKNNYYSFSTKIKFIDLGINYYELTDISIFKKIIRTYKKKREHKERLSRLLYELKADIVISMFTHEMSFLCDINDGSKKILELHFSKKFRYYNDLYNKAGFIKRIISKYLDFRDNRKIPKYDKFVVLTEEDKVDWKNLWNIQVIYNPMSFIPKKEVNINSKQILAVGRLCKQKGFDLLIEIWNSIIKENKDNGYYISIYGSGPDEEDLNKKINDYGLNNSITIYKPIRNIEDIYYNTSIFCLTSRYEGLPMVLIEVMSCGIVPISFKCPCGPFDIIINQYDGILVDCFDIDNFKNSLIDLINNSEKRKVIGSNAKNTIKKKFSTPFIMNQWNELFCKLITKR